MANDSMFSRTIRSTVSSSPKSVTNNEAMSQWPKVGVLLYNSSGQCGYQYLPQIICKRLSNIINNKNNSNNNINNNNSNKCSDYKNSFETIVCEMIFGSVALNFCAKNSSKIHKLSEDLLMTSFIFQIDFSNGKTYYRKYGLALIWDTNEWDGELRQLILKESLIMDSLIDELKNDLIDSRLKTPKDIHRSVTKFIKTINDYLSVCRLTSNISDDQFIDELVTLIRRFDTKGTHFFVSNLLTSILMFKFKSKKMKLILWSKDVNKISIISQFLLVVNQFLKPKTKKISYSSPQMKSIKFCRNLTAQKRTSSVTPITKSIISERKSRDESLGYESLTESGSTTTSTICDYNGFASKTLDASTPLEQSLEQSIERLSTELLVDSNEPKTDEMQSSSQLNKSRNYFREYRNLRFTSNQLSDEFNDQQIETNSLSSNKCQFNEDLSDADSQYCSNSSKCDDFGTDTTDVEEIHESHLLSGFGQTSMPELIPDSTSSTNELSLSSSPTISDTYLSQISIQGIINSKTITSFEDLISNCMKRSTNELNENTIIVCDCDLWQINYIESSRSCPAIMSSTIGNLCETITELHSLGMNSLFIREFIENRINELTIKSSIVKSLIDNCGENHIKQNLMKMFEKDSKQSLLSLIVDNYLFDFSSTDCSNLGFDLSDIPVIIALNRHFLTNDYNYCKNSERNVSDFEETVL